MKPELSPHGADALEPPWPSPRYAWYVVGVLLLAYTLSFIDRMILSLLISPIRSALHVSDTQVSLLLGMAFALFYTVLGLPLGWIADRKNRRTLMIAGVAIWSVMTAGCGLAGSFWTLFLARMGVGIGEATLSPSAYSVLSDYFPKDKLARAVAVYSLGVPLGAGIALVLGAFVIKLIIAAPPVVLPLLGSIEAWRLTFLWVAAPGLAVAALLFTVREPYRRGRTLQVAAGRGDGFVPFLATHRWAISAHIGGMSLISLFMYGLMAWTPTFFARTYGLSPADAGLGFGVVMAVCGTGGLLLGGWLADRKFAAGRRDALLWTMRLSILLGGPFLFLMPLMPSPALAFVLLTVGMFLITMHGVAGAALQLITPNQYRARLAAIYMFVANLVGMGLGPTAFALVTDYVFHDDASLRYSIAIVAAIALPLAAVVLSLGLKPFARSVELAEAGHA